MNNKLTEKIVMTGFFIALGTILPQLFHMAGLGSVISPMHFTVLICGLLLGSKFGLACGILTPLLASLLFGKPVIFPSGLSMAIELAVYGFVAGLIKSKFAISTDKYINLYFFLLAAMIAGRVIAIVTNFILYTSGHSSNNFLAYLKILFVTGLPGIVLQLLLIPPIYLRIEEVKK